jgi:hypothetical protein
MEVHVLPQTEVVVKDIEMSFGSMVKFMIKWAIASIPALVILLFLIAFVASFVGGLGGLFSSR